MNSQDLADRYPGIFKVMKIKCLKFILGVALLFCSSLMLAQSASTPSFQAQARVIDVSERYITVRELQPREECRQVQVRRGGKDTSSDTPEILGALIGGAVGKNLDDDNASGGKTGAVLGALLGASIASDIEKQNAQGSGEVVTELRCTTVQTEVEVRRMNGYNVSYEYGGNIFSTTMKSRPGDTVNVNVYVLPVN